MKWLTDESLFDFISSRISYQNFSPPQTLGTPQAEFEPEPNLS